MPEAFTHTSLPGRIVLGPGSLDQVPDEADQLGISKVLLIATRSARDAADLLEVGLGDRFAGRIDEVRQHVPKERADQARAKASEVGATGLVAIGGGSAIGLAKAIALTSGLPIVAVPTTYAGSEMTPVWGETAEGEKTTGTDLVVLPKTVVYDPLLSRGLPLEVTAASVANAMAHCVEATWTPKADPITEVTAVEGVRALREGLLSVLAERTDLEARSNLLYGASLAGSALATAGTGLHHKLCHLLGGSYNLPHAETHAAVLPQVTRLNAGAVPRAKARLETALETDDLASGLFDLFAQAGVPTSLRELGLTEEQAREAAWKFAAKAPANPVPLDEDTVTEILLRAWAGERPTPAAAERPEGVTQ
ncbi:maleylacetate reductase [Kribbella orskensis]|uniref:Maleylacetate reductase n=1 Tax=Kribbella orskensis TaxID=2512216 RepID=A0ABY2BH93_9ACTN|nr:MULTISPECIES: maleylacetate reductase [Kribbella]TCN36981.1 maleylacetate reductase [Kribbella sp. VKM Ac-2500]TCO18406.1 maleylacetate reductase [Kribbella orskensis]